MKALFTAAAAGTLACLTLAACTVHQTEAPAPSGPSDLALSVRMQATPDSVTIDGGSQSSVKIFANGPDGKPINALPFRVDMGINTAGGIVMQDVGTLSARSIVTGSDGVASVVFTAPAALPVGAPACNGLAGSACVSIVATPTSTNFGTVATQTVTIRLVPLGVIQPPARTPAPCIQFSPATPAANALVTFTGGTLVNNACGLPSSDITAFDWNFGDGGTGTGRVVTHTFTAGNSFNVTLTETNDRGVSASTSVAVPVGSAQLPVSQFAFSPAAPGVNEPVFFNASTSSAGAGHTIASFSWTFGDGAVGSGITVSHPYATTGTYTVVLTVRDEVGQSGSSSQPVGVGTNTPGPTARFTFSPTTPSAGTTVTFDGSTSTTAQGQRIQFFDWTFGDGTGPVRTTTPAVSHLFGLAGTFNVNLVVTDTANRTASTSNSVIVAAADSSFPSGISISFTPNPSKVNQETSFVAFVSSPGTGSTAITNYLWDFGDGTQPFSTSVNNVGYTYRRTGVFTVKLTVTNNVGKSSSGTTTVTVTP